jgi:hypothetical protein
MPDPAAVPAPPSAPAKKPTSPLRWVFLGCGILLGLMILGFSGCAGIMYFIYKGTDPIAAVGADYLKKSPEVQKALGPEITVTRHKMGWNVQTANDTGSARITYTAQGGNGSAEAVVWLVKSAGAWTAVGARLHSGSGDAVEVGKPPREHHRIDRD